MMMKAFLLLLPLMLVATHATAQPDDIPDNLFSGYGGPIYRFTTFDGKGGLLIGNFNGVTLSKNLVIGGGGFTLIQSFDSTLGLSLGYGGLGAEYVVKLGESFFISGNLMLCGGGARSGTTTSGVFVADLNGTAGIELLPFMRIGIMGGYRLAAGVDLPDYTSSDVGGPGAALYMIFGNFF